MGDTFACRHPSLTPFAFLLAQAEMHWSRHWTSRLVEALDLAAQHLEPPLTSAELGRGWSDNMRMLILASVNQIKSDIDKTHCVQPDHYKSCIKSEMIDPRVEDIRWSFALGPDGAVTDIEDAEELLNAAISLSWDRPFLGASLPGKGFQEQTIASLRQTAAVLASGRYITMDQFQVWDEILTTCGVRRRVLPTTISTERMHPGGNFDPIEERPRQGMGSHRRLRPLVC
jgi:hypothetical protein